MTPKPESETDPWQTVKRYQRHVGGTFLSPVGGWCFWHEVDAARSAEAAQHQQDRMRWAETLKDQHKRHAVVEAERDRLKAALERIDGMCGDPPRDRCPCGCPTGVLAVQVCARAALTPQGQSTDGETR